MWSSAISAHLEEVPQVHEEAGEHELLRLGDEAVGHEAEVLHQFGGAVYRHVHVELGAAQQTQQEIIDLRASRKQQNDPVFRSYKGILSYTQTTSSNKV